MKNADEAEYGIAVQHGSQQMCVWPLYRHPPAGYSLSPQRGTLAEMEALLGQEFVETEPARHCHAAGFPDSTFAPWEGALRF